MENQTAVQWVAIDLKDPTYKRVAGFSRRIAYLLKARPTDPHLRDTLDLFLGALYAIVLAKEGGFVDRVNKSTQLEAITTRVARLGEGNFRPDGKWMAGFHFNSALFRIAAVYHRLLKIVLEDPQTGATRDTLRPKADKAYLKWTKKRWSRANADAVYGEVNHIKHKPSATLAQRQAKFNQAHEAAEELLQLVEAYVQYKRKA